MSRELLAPESHCHWWLTVADLITLFTIFPREMSPIHRESQKTTISPPYEAEQGRAFQDEARFKERA